MSLVETFHAEHKARLSRLGGIPPKSPNLSALEQQQQQIKITELQTRIERQKDIIADLNSTVAKQRNIIRKFAGEEDIQTPRIADVIAVVSEHFNMTKIVLTGPGRSGNVAFARQIGYYLSREYGYAFLPIGRGFCKDHSSVLYGAQKVAKRLLDDPRLARQIDGIKAEIEKYVARRIETVKGAFA